MPRFFVPREFIKSDSIYITGEEAHHILDVMRLKVSDEVVIFDGSGKEYTCIVKSAGRKSLEAGIKSAREVSAASKVSLTLIQAIPKKDKMDYIVEKAAELGVLRIIPVTTKRTIPEWSDTKKSDIVERWRKLAKEAAKQCGRPDIPEINPITPFRDCFGPSGLAMTVLESDLKLIAVLSDKAIKLKDILKDSNGKNVTIAIGPEGDFTPPGGRGCSKRGF